MKNNMYSLKIENYLGDAIEPINAETPSELVHKAVLLLINTRLAPRTKNNPVTSFSFEYDNDTVREVIRMVNSSLEDNIRSLKNILTKSLTGEIEFTWDHFKDHSIFTIPEVIKPLKYAPVEPKISDYEYNITKTTFEDGIERPQYGRIPPEPNITDEEYHVEIDFIDVLFPRRKRKKLEAAKEKFNEAHRNWQKLKEKVEELRQQKFERDHENWEKLKEEIEKENETITRQYKEELQVWRQKKVLFTRQQNEYNLSIDNYSKGIEKKLPGTVIYWFTRILEKVDFSVSYTKQFLMEYDPTVKILAIDIYLPSPDDIPNIKIVKFNQTQEKIIEVLFNDKEREKLFDDIIYQLILLTSHKLFKHDYADVLDAVVLNGWVSSVNKATGKIIKACIITIQASKNEFTQLDLSKVDPKSCFRLLKGIGSSKLHTLSAVAPIISISHEDKRFVQSHDVADRLNEGSNLAAMDWEEFEHLIRELFEKEFQKNGGEVKITQASRDGGVDAIAFDPDPIRGGKIVIQAKRYTNVVGVSAVRDLYGTLLNEGATKGI